MVSADSAHLGLFTRVYPRKGTSERYSKFWTNGYSAVQKLAAAWVEAAEDTIGAETAAEWIAQLRADDSEFAAMSDSSPVGARRAPAPPPFGQQYRLAETGGPDKRDRVDQQQTKRQTITLQQQLRQRIAERYAQTNSPQPGP